MSDIQKEATIITAGGRIQCRRCQALSKRSREQCKKPALRNKSVCGFHGGKSTGPRTQEGRKRIADAKTVHGEETRAKRQEYSESSAYLRELEDVAWALNMMTGDGTRGRKPSGYRPVKSLEQARKWIAADALSLHHKAKF